MFMGEYRFNIDEKKRINIPTDFRKQFSEFCIISCGIEKCVTIYTEDAWNSYYSQIEKLAATKKANREYTRMMLSRTFRHEIDAKGRIKLEDIHINYANISKECVVIGSGSYIEIWDKASWDEYFKEHLSALDDLSEGIDFLD